jgi:hypothetical protein
MEASVGITLGGAMTTREELLRRLWSHINAIGNNMVQQGSPSIVTHHAEVIVRSKRLDQNLECDGVCDPHETLWSMLPQASARRVRDKGRLCSSRGGIRQRLTPSRKSKWAVRSSALPTRIAPSLVCGDGEQKQVAVRIFDDEVSRAPCLLLEGLEERDVRGPELKEKLLNLIGRAGHCRR